MSEENQGTVDAVIDTGTSTETTQVAPEVVVDEPIVEEETLEAKYERVTKERDQAIARAEKTQKGLLKVKRKGQSKAEALAQELSQTKSRLHEYTGAEEQPKQQPLSEQQLERVAEYRVRCKELDKDKEFSALFEKKTQEGVNPFVENKMISQVMAHRGVDPSIVRYILTDDDLMEEFSDTEDSYEIVALLSKAKERAKAQVSKAKEEKKVTKPVNEPKAIPSQKTNNNATSPSAKRSPKDYYAEFVAKKTR